jgi:ABC-type proline/glycine betaine transport system permease subunit
MSFFGQVAAVSIAVIGLGGGILLAYEGCAFAGLTAFIGTLGTLACAVAYDRINKKKAAATASDQQESTKS